MHSQMMLSEKLLTGTYILIGLEIIKVVICSISAYRRHIKKEYSNKEGQLSAISKLSNRESVKM